MEKVNTNDFKLNFVVLRWPEKLIKEKHVMTSVLYFFVFFTYLKTIISHSWLIDPSLIGIISHVCLSNSFLGPLVSFLHWRDVLEIVNIFGFFVVQKTEESDSNISDDDVLSNR